MIIFGFWVFMLIMDLLAPAVMVVFGSMFIRRPPKDINWIYGYRTSMSMKNMDTWVFAHGYCGKLLRNIGLAMFICSAAAMLFVLGKEVAVVGIWGGIVAAVQIVFVIVPIIFTEMALRANFDALGNRRK